MDVSSWLGSLPGETKADPGASWLGSLPHETVVEPEKPSKEVEVDELLEPPNPEDELVALGFELSAVLAALAANAGDFDEALASLTHERAAKRQRTDLPDGQNEEVGDELLEIEGIQCSLTKAGELVMRLPEDPQPLGPRIGRRKADGESITFDGMDDWLMELYESHPPRVAPLPPSLDLSMVKTELDRGAAYIWNRFATTDEVASAHAELEALFADGKMKRGDASWIDECAEGGHASNRRTLEGVKRKDACGFWDLRGGTPAPPPAIMTFFRRLEAAAVKLREVHGWPVLCSRVGMAAVYDGQGAFYSQHRDNEWQRHLRPRILPAGSPPGPDGAGAWMCFRELTMLAYVNPPEVFGEDEAGKLAGGRLRTYVNTQRGDLTGTTASEFIDVPPCGGTAVIFRSRELLHEVLASHKRRYCLTLWFQTTSDA